MSSTRKKAKEYLKPSLITALTIFALSFLTNPTAKVLDSLISDFSEKATKMLILQLWVGLLILLFGMLSYIIYLYKKFNYKRTYRFGIYWHKTKPYCPYCGTKLQNMWEWFECPSCENRLVPCDDVKKLFPKIKDVLEIIKKET